MSLKFNATSAELLLIGRIADRAIENGTISSHRSAKRILMMDLEAVHCNGCKLALDKLVLANNSDFTHDIVGIQANVNRITAKLDNSFGPRFALSSHQKG